jgi:GT2 family glycosyltransferase
MTLPFISIIIPVYNSQSTIERCLDSIMELNYPSDKREVILVVNNSTDQSEYSAKKYPVTILRENRVQSAYASRNLGIQYAKGEIFAFTDSDCFVSPDWLLNYVKYLEKKPSDIVAGQVEILERQKPNIYETYDRCKFDQEFFVREFNFGATANLMVKRTVFEKIGTFDRSLISSGDLEFCQKAFRSGYNINYCQSAIVRHPARSTFKELIKKEARIGFGYSQIYFKHRLGNLFIHRWRLFFPNRDFLRFKSSELNFGRLSKAKFVFVDWICNCAWIFGNLRGILKLKMA